MEILQVFTLGRLFIIIFTVLTFVGIYFSMDDSTDSESSIALPDNSMSTDKTRSNDENHQPKNHTPERLHNQNQYAQLLEKALASPALISHRELKALWIMAADQDDFSKAIAALEGIAQSTTANLTTEALYYRDDLIQLRQTTENSNNIAFVIEAPEINGQDIDPYRLDQLAYLIEYETNDQQAITAIHELSLYRAEQVMDVLLRVSQQDSTERRIKALRALWTLSADGVKSDLAQVIQMHFSEARQDSEPGIAELATSAFNDLYTSEGIFRTELNNF